MHAIKIRIVNILIEMDLGSKTVLNLTIYSYRTIIQTLI